MSFWGLTCTAIPPFLADGLEWPCPVRSALKRTPVQDFNSFPIIFYYIISITYQKIGDLFCPVIFLDFRIFMHNILPTTGVICCWSSDFSIFPIPNLDQSNLPPGQPPSRATSLTGNLPPGQPQGDFVVFCEAFDNFFLSFKWDLYEQGTYFRFYEFKN